MKNNGNGFFKTVKEKRITTVAGAWVFYFLTALLPLVFLLITAFSVFKVDLSTQLIGKLPAEFQEAGEVVIGTAKNASKGITVFFFFTVIFSGSALLNQMSKDGEYIYGKKPENKNGFLRRLFSIGALGVLFFIFLGLAFLFAFGSKVALNMNLHEEYNPIITVVAFTLVIITCFLTLVLLHKFICPVKINFFPLILGSFVSLSVIVSGTILFTLYLRFINNYNAFYGSLASIIVFLLWAYILMFGIITGATASMSITKRERSQNDKPAV